MAGPRSGRGRPLKLVFFGTSVFAVPILRAISEHVLLVVSQPDRPSGRKMILQPSPVSLAADELGLLVAKPEKARDPDFISMIEAFDADLLVVAAYGQILKERLLNAGHRGAVNLHGSILPSYRGAAPIQRAIAAGDPETGVTLMQMDVGMDTGDMIAIAKTSIGPDETFGELHERLGFVAADLLVEWLPKLVAGEITRTPQNNDLATYAAKIDKEDAILSFDQSAQVAYNRFRSVTPTPGAVLTTSLGTIKVIEARFSETRATAGEVIDITPDLVVTFQEGSLILKTVQPVGKNKMSGRDWANGARLRPGSNLCP